MKCKCKKNSLLTNQTLCWKCWGGLSVEEKREDISNSPDRPAERITYDPRSKRINQPRDSKDTLQPFKKVDGKVVENKKFMEAYGTDPIKEHDPEKARYYTKKGYDKTLYLLLSEEVWAVLCVYAVLSFLCI